jgi:thiamine kinase-like enzyme
MITSKKVAIALFVEKMVIPIEQINSVKKIHHGYTNLSYLIECHNGNKYQLRLGGANDIVSRKNEYECIHQLKLKEYLYYDKDNGNSIKSWIAGDNITSWKDEVIVNAARKIKELHSKQVNLERFIRFDPMCFLDNGNDLSVETREIYKSLNEKYKDDEYNFCHNDLNGRNMLVNEANEVFLIDYEWCRVNSPYWELANLIREEDFDEYKKSLLVNTYDKKMSMSKINDFLFLTTCFAYQWTYAMKTTSKIMIYRRHVDKMMKKYLSQLSTETTKTDLQNL